MLNIDDHSAHENGRPDSCTRGILCLADGRCIPMNFGETLDLPNSSEVEQERLRNGWDLVNAIVLLGKFELSDARYYIDNRPTSEDRSYYVEEFVYKMDENMFNLYVTHGANGYDVYVVTMKHGELAGRSTQVQLLVRDGQPQKIVTKGIINNRVEYDDVDFLSENNPLGILVPKIDERLKILAFGQWLHSKLVPHVDTMLQGIYSDLGVMFQLDVVLITRFFGKSV